ncbi:hypothetical protein PS874_00024 [Pseudomonas fluorescens]|uniref:Uncharacterized protein n=1 Tax=Pseudomonas silesiensis TaxID=1853130 RepID=A0A191YYD8_9PSED|nr:hypothetical protein [Pseudomonas silesiensis]ANJ57768.1 hypothetical protein PMA3_22445 [Pseudomonas silesiensis]VVO48277.1 hypothetical protein PS874_00024 [Pseudomonas fluorescens]
MTKQAQNEQLPPTATKKSPVIARRDDGRFVAVSSLANEVVERQAAKAFAGSALSQTGAYKAPRAPRVPHLQNLERELRDLKKVVDALAVRSVVHDQSAQLSDSVDFEGMTVLDADTAYQMLDNPPEPNKALRNLLALR